MGSYAIRYPFSEGCDHFLGEERKRRQKNIQEKEKKEKREEKDGERSREAPEWISIGSKVARSLDREVFPLFDEQTSACFAVFSQISNQSFVKRTHLLRMREQSII